jgi:hypothetical protein
MNPDGRTLISPSCGICPVFMTYTLGAAAQRERSNADPNAAGPHIRLSLEASSRCSIDVYQKSVLLM